MLKHWNSHAEYQHFISESVASLSPSQLKKLYSMSDSWNKLTSMNLDPVGEFLAPFYSHTGRPAINQPQILRSFVLMLDRKFFSLSNWVNELKPDDLLAMLIGCSPDTLPPLGSYFDFINRLWLRNPEFEKLGRNDLFPADKNKKPSSRPGKGRKLPNRHAGVTQIVADYALQNRDFPFYYEKALQQLFSIAAITPSLELGLIPSDNLTVSGDGTCVHSHASPYGHKVCDCAENSFPNCSCPRHFSDPDASWGWDSDLNMYYYGHTLYMLSCYNKQFQTDLPLHIRFFDAKHHDSVSGIISLSEFRQLNPDLQVKNLCLDIDMDGTPLCPAGFRMVYWGYSPKRHDCKWRCPVACGKEEKCTCEVPCSSSPYGRCIYTKPDWDIRLYPPVPRGTEVYIKTYNNRTSSERVNNRILNYYHLQDMKIHGKKRYSFFAMIAGINIHLDARLKVQKLKTA